jgi:hypothetical protein
MVVYAMVLIPIVFLIAQLLHFHTILLSKGLTT